MNTKPSYPCSLYMVSCLIGGIVGAISLTLIDAILLSRIPIEETPSQLEASGFRILGILFACILGAGVGTILAVISGKIGCAIKPSKGASLFGAALGSVVMVAILPALSAAIQEVVNLF